MSRRHGPVNRPVKGIVVRAVVVPKGFEGCSDHGPVVLDLQG